MFAWMGDKVSKDRAGFPSPGTDIMPIGVLHREAASAFQVPAAHAQGQIDQIVCRHQQSVGAPGGEVSGHVCDSIRLNTGGLSRGGKWRKMDDI
jgi:hypothetical protein